MGKKTIYIWMAFLIYANQSPAGINKEGTDKINWLTYEQAQQQNEDSSRKFFFYFRANWCAYCHKLEKETFADATIAGYINRNFIPVRIDSDRKKKLAARFGVRGLPDLRFLSPKGEPIARWPGYISASKLLPMLKYIHTDSYLNMGYGDFLKQR